MPSPGGRMTGLKRSVVAWLGLSIAVAGYLHLHAAVLQTGQAAVAGPSARIPNVVPDQSAPPGLDRNLLQQYCVGCHNERLKTGGLALDTLDVADVDTAAEVWEKVALKLRGGMMPPAGRPRPDREAIARFVATLEARLDEAAAKHFEPRRVPVHRLNRAEYINAVRDLLGVTVGDERMLPADESSHGFDNMAGTLVLSPALLDRYLTVAWRISRLAVGDPTIGAAFATNVYTVPMKTVQNARMSENLPFGTRGGLSFEHSFPLDGEYEINIRLTRSVDQYIVNIDLPHDLDVRIDGRRAARFTVGGQAAGKAAPISYSGTIMASKTPIEGEAERGGPFPTQEWDNYRNSADAGLNIRLAVKAGRRRVGVSFIEQTQEGEGILQPPLREYAATVTETTDLTTKPEGPGVASVTVAGPRDATGPGETTSRRKIFICRPTRQTQEVACARRILSTLARRAYRRPVTDGDIQPLLAFYQEAASTRGFYAGIQAAWSGCSSIPNSCFASSGTPPVAPGGGYAVDTWNWRRVSRFSCGAAFPTTSCWTRGARQAEGPGRARTTGAADAGGLRGRGARGQLRRPVAVAAEHERSVARTPICSPTSTRTCARRSSGNRAVRRQHSPRRSQRHGSAERQLHVPQRTSRAALRHSERLSAAGFER